MERNNRQAGIQRAVKLFSQPIWTRLLEALYQKYLALGRIGGQVVLENCSIDEQREIASLLGKRSTSSSTVTVRLSDIQQALETYFACSLPSLLHALYPDRPQTPRPEQQKARIQAQEYFHAELHTIANPADHRGQRWLQEGRHGLSYLFTRHKNAPRDEQSQLLAALHHVLQALYQLPTPPAYKRLAPFAQQISGDPHYFDANTLAGRLLFYALRDLAELDQQRTSTETNGLVENGDEEIQTNMSRTQERQRLLLYYDAGLLLDTLSSTVAISNLVGATINDGQGNTREDQMISAGNGRLQVLPLRQLLMWREVWGNGPTIYVLENPQVFETLYDEIEVHRQKYRDNTVFPTLVCTAGWPSTAAIRLLTLLLETRRDIKLFYSGDFDVQGLRIAAHLLVRFSGRCELWRYDPASYQAALHSQSQALSEQDLVDIQSLPAAFGELVKAMREMGKKGYQEGIIAELLEDVLNQ